MVKIRFLGGTHEVGRNAILVQSKERKTLLDYGVKIGEKPEFPGHIRAKDVDGIILAHAHLDHSGGAPIFYLRDEKPIFATTVTFEILRILIRDMIKLSGYYLPFEYIEFDSMIKQRRDLQYGKSVRFGDTDFRFSNAGHIPGSAMVILKANGKRILYTGDFNTENTRLVHGARVPKQRFDAVIIESTYAKTDHPPRRELEESFSSAIKRVQNNKGKVLVPAFAVGRSQEILCIINSQKVGVKCAVDGMARAVNRVLVDHPDFVRTPKTFLKIINSTREVRGRRDREKVLNRVGVVVAPSGMLQGGTAIHYLEKLAQDERNAILLVSFQVPGTGGAKLLESRHFTINELDEEVKAKVRHFDFSSHCGKSMLEEFLKNMKGKPEVFVIHGEPENCEALAQYARDELELKASAPAMEEEFSI
jgi:putative mRNA 3-end processing factor